MNSNRLNQIVEEQLALIKDVLVTKAKEYATDKDRLHNFNKAARVSGSSRERALMGFALKHIVSVDDMIDNLEEGKLPTKAQLDEKFTDTLNYYILLKICITDRMDEADRKAFAVSGEQGASQQAVPGVYENTVITPVIGQIKSQERELVARG